MKPFVFAVAVSLLLFCTAATAQTNLESGALWSNLEVPGTASGLAKASQLNIDAMGPARLMLELVRVRRLPDSLGISRQSRLEAYIESLERFQFSKAALGTSDVNLTLSTQNSERFRSFVKSIGLTVTAARKGSPTRISRSSDSVAGAARSVLETAGLDLDGVEDRLNAGESVHLDLPSFVVPLPMTPQWWSFVVFGHPVTPDRLFHAIISDEKASLLYYGLASVDPGTRAYLAATPKLASKIYSDHAAVFATYGGSLHVRDGQIDAPGGPRAVDFWQVLTGEKVTTPARFIESVLSADAGHVAYFYHLLDALDPPRVSFALGLYEDSVKRSPRQLADSVYGWFNISDQRWQPERRPFVRPAFDPSLLLIEVGVDKTGHPVGPAWQYLWNAVFDGTSLPDRPEKQLKARAEVADAPFLIDAIFRKTDLEQRDRLATFLFAQRVFAAAPEESTPDLLVALRGFRRFRMLELTLERIGIRSPSTYAAAARRAANLSDIQNADLAAASISQFQGALALIERATLTARISTDDALSLVQSLIAVELDHDGSYGANIALWLDRKFIPAVAAASVAAEAVTAERTLLAGLAGMRELRALDAPDADGPLIEWEGWQYRLDLSAALLDRLVRVRARQGGNSLDAVLMLARVVAALSGNPTLEEVASQLAQIQQLQKALQEPKSPRSLTNTRAVTVKEAILAASNELARIKNAKQLKDRVRSARAWLESLTASVTADLLREIVYATYINDPNTPLLAGDSVSSRHDLGLEAPSLEKREDTAWGFPDQPFVQGAKFHIRGSLLGLDLALADLALQRTTVGKAPDVPIWYAPDRKVYTQVLALFNPFDSRLNSVRLVADTIKRGRDRVARFAVDRSDLNAAFEVARIGPLRRSLILWTLDREPTTAQKLFSLAELVRIGGGEESLLAARAWGASAIPLNGCLCLTLGPPVDWEVFTGREGAGITGIMAASSPDLLLRFVEVLADLKLPPALAGDILPWGVSSALDESHLDYADDWLGLMRHTSSISRRTIEEYVSRVTTGQSMIPVAAVVK